MAAAWDEPRRASTSIHTYWIPPGAPSHIRSAPPHQHHVTRPNHTSYVFAAISPTCCRRWGDPYRGGGSRCAGARPGQAPPPLTSARPRRARARRPPPPARRRGEEQNRRARAPVTTTRCDTRCRSCSLLADAPCVPVEDDSLKSPSTNVTFVKTCIIVRSAQKSIAQDRGA